MVILLKINTCEKSENLEKNPYKSEPGQNFNNNFFFKFFFMVFLKLPWRK